MDYFVDRRKHKRYVLRQGVFVGFSPNMGEVINISMDGILFQYLDFAKGVEEGNDFIICSEDGYCLDRFPCRVVSDKVLANESSFSQIVTRQRRVEFGELTKTQKSILADFIEHHKRPEDQQDIEIGVALDELGKIERLSLKE